MAIVMATLGVAAVAVRLIFATAVHPEPTSGMLQPVVVDEATLRP
jgi:hypothetical protein